MNSDNCVMYRNREINCIETFFEENVKESTLILEGSTTTAKFTLLKRNILALNRPYHVVDCYDFHNLKLIYTEVLRCLFDFYEPIFSFIEFRCKYRRFMEAFSSGINPNIIMVFRHIDILDEKNLDGLWHLESELRKSLAVVLISNLNIFPQDMYSDASYTIISFDPYTRAQFRSILLEKRKEYPTDIYTKFLDFFIPFIFSTGQKNIHLSLRLVDHLYPLFSVTQSTTKPENLFSTVENCFAQYAEDPAGILSLFEGPRRSFIKNRFHWNDYNGLRSTSRDCVMSSLEPGRCDCCGVNLFWAHEIGFYNCSECSLYFPTQISFNRHYLFVHSCEPKVQCPKCNRSYPPNWYPKHLKFHNNPECITLSCLCGQYHVLHPLEEKEKAVTETVSSKGESREGKRESKEGKRHSVEWKKEERPAGKKLKTKNSVEAGVENTIKKYIYSKMLKEEVNPQSLSQPKKEVRLYDKKGKGDPVETKDPIKRKQTEFDCDRVLVNSFRNKVKKKRSSYMMEDINKNPTQRTIEVDTSYRCRYCNTQLTSPIELVDHFTKDHSDEDKKYMHRCVCGEYLNLLALTFINHYALSCDNTHRNFVDEEIRLYKVKHPDSNLSKCDIAGLFLTKSNRIWSAYQKGAKIPNLDELTTSKNVGKPKIMKMDEAKDDVNRWMDGRSLVYRSSRPCSDPTVSRKELQQVIWGKKG